MPRMPSTDIDKMKSKIRRKENFYGKDLQFANAL